MKNTSVVLPLLISLFLVGCSSGSSHSEASSSLGGSSPTSVASPEPSSSSSKPHVAVTSVALDQTSLELLSGDDPVTLNATVLPENASNKAVTWESSNAAAATVSDGVITPVASGTTTITAKTVDGGLTAQCAVTVKEPVTIPNYVLHGLFYGNDEWTDKPMVINPASTTEYMIQGVSLHADDVFKIHMFGEKWFGYSALKTTVKSGLVFNAPTDDNIQVYETGVYDIYCDYNASFGGHIYIGKVDGSTPSTVSASGISLSHSGKYLLVRNEFIITPTVYPDNATNKEVIWTSSDESVAKVTSAGRVVASNGGKVGSTTITAKTADGGFTATCLVYVSASQYPDYCLTGMVGGYYRSGISMRHAAIPLATKGKYLIPDVDLVGGDALTVTDNYGARLRGRNNQIYEKQIDKDMSVNVYLDVNAANMDYLSFAPKQGSN